MKKENLKLLSTKEVTTLIDTLMEKIEPLKKLESKLMKEFILRLK